MESTLVRLGCVLVICLRGVVVFIAIILQLVLSGPGHSRPSVQGGTTSNDFSLPKDIFSLENLINVHTLLLELVVFMQFCHVLDKENNLDL